jgi:hypothetical protein
MPLLALCPILFLQLIFKIGRKIVYVKNLGAFIEERIQNWKY